SSRREVRAQESPWAHHGRRSRKNRCDAEAGIVRRISPLTTLLMLAGGKLQSGPGRACEDSTTKLLAQAGQASTWSAPARRICSAGTTVSAPSVKVAVTLLASASETSRVTGWSPKVTPVLPMALDATAKRNAATFCFPTAKVLLMC